MNWIVVFSILQIIQHNWAAPIAQTLNGLSSELSTEATSLTKIWQDGANSTEITIGITNSYEMVDNMNHDIFEIQNKLEKITETTSEDKTSSNEASSNATLPTNITKKGTVYQEALNETTTNARRISELQSDEDSFRQTTIFLQNPNSEKQEDLTTSSTIRENMEDKATTDFPLHKQSKLEIKKEIEPLPQLKQAVDYFIKDVLELGDKPFSLEEEMKAKANRTNEKSIPNNLQQTDENISVQTPDVTTDTKLDNNTFINVQTPTPEFAKENVTLSLNSVSVKNVTEKHEKKNLDTSPFISNTEQYEATNLMQETLNPFKKQPSNSSISQLPVLEISTSIEESVTMPAIKHPSDLSISLLAHEDATTISALKHPSASFGNQSPAFETFTPLPINREHYEASKISVENSFIKPALKQHFDLSANDSILNKDSATIPANTEQYTTTDVNHYGSTTSPAAKPASDSFTNALQAHEDYIMISENKEQHIGPEISPVSQPFDSFVKQLSNMEESIEKAVKEVISRSTPELLQTSSSETNGTKNIPCFKQAIASFIEDIKEVGERLNLAKENTTDKPLVSESKEFSSEENNFQNDEPLKLNSNLVPDNWNQTLEDFPAAIITLQHLEEEAGKIEKEISTNLPLAEPSNELLNKSWSSIEQEIADHISGTGMELFTPIVIKTEAANASASEGSAAKVLAEEQFEAQLKNVNSTTSTQDTLSKNFSNAAQAKTEQFEEPVTAGKHIDEPVKGLYTPAELKTEAANELRRGKSMENQQSAQESDPDSLANDLTETSANTLNEKQQNVEVMHDTLQPIKGDDLTQEKLQTLENKMETHLQEPTTVRQMDTSEEQSFRQTEGPATKQFKLASHHEAIQVNSQSSKNTAEETVIESTKIFGTDNDIDEYNQQADKIPVKIIFQAEQEASVVPISHLIVKETFEKLQETSAVMETTQRTTLPFSTSAESTASSIESSTFAAAIESQRGTATQQPELEPKLSGHINKTQQSSQSDKDTEQLVAATTKSYVSPKATLEPEIEIKNKTTVALQQLEQDTTTVSISKLAIKENAENLLSTPSSIEATESTLLFSTSSPESITFRTESSTLAPAPETTQRTRDFNEALQTDENLEPEITQLHRMQQTVENSNAFEDGRVSKEPKSKTTESQNEEIPHVMADLEISTLNLDSNQLHRNGVIRQNFIDEFADSPTANVNKSTPISEKELLQLQESSFSSEESSKPTITNLTTTSTTTQPLKLFEDDDGFNEDITTAQSITKDLSVTTSTANMMDEDTTIEMDADSTEYIAETTTQTHFINEPLQKDFNSFSLNATAQADAVVSTPETLTMTEEQKEIKQTSTELLSTATKTEEPEQETTTLLLTETHLKEMESTTKATQLFAEKNQEYRTTSDLRKNQQQSQIESTTANAAQIESTDASEEQAATTTMQEEAQIQTEQQTTETEIHSTTLEQEYETTVTPKEPEARSLPPPKLEHTQSDEGVEVFYGYSSVKHN